MFSSTSENSGNFWLNSASVSIRGFYGEKLLREFIKATGLPDSSLGSNLDKVIESYKNQLNSDIDSVVTSQSDKLDVLDKLGVDWKQQISGVKTYSDDVAKGVLKGVNTWLLPITIN